MQVDKYVILCHIKIFNYKKHFDFLYNLFNYEDLIITVPIMYCTILSIAISIHIYKTIKKFHPKLNSSIC